MKKGSNHSGRKKLSRQFIAMVLMLQIFTVLFFSILLKKESIDGYLSAKNDSITNNISTSLLCAVSIPTFKWGINYWGEHYEELARETTKSDMQVSYDLEYSLSYEEEELKKQLGSMSKEELFDLARGTYIDFTQQMGSSYDYYGFEGCSCFMPLEDGRYVNLFIKDKDAIMISDPFQIDENNSVYDVLMSKVSDKTYVNTDEVFNVDFTDIKLEVDYIRLNSVDEQGKRHKIYMGYVPIVFDGEIKAVLTMKFNYDFFDARINNIIKMVFFITVLANVVMCVLMIYQSRAVATGPIIDIQNAVREYVTTKNGVNARKALTNINSENEIGVLADDISQMTLEIGDYVEKIREEGIRRKNLTKEVMEALAKAIDARDKYTNGHSYRVANYSKMIAEKVGKSEEECEEIYFAALLHDIGKIGMPNTILLKKGELAKEEYEKAMEHTIVGSNILKGIHQSPWLSMGAKYHHERYDGTGYPEGLKGERIPMVARIIAVADAYDAMTSNRSYRNAVTQKVARAELERGMGTQFDPEFAWIMIKMIDKDTEFKMKEIDAGSIA